jgi:hypothetical protein
MKLMTCLYQLQGYGIKFIHRQGRLVIQSTSYELTEAQTTCLKAHKALLLSILPLDTAHTTSTLLDAVEAYLEREAIILESSETLDLAHSIALQQAQAVLKSPQFAFEHL